MGRTGRRGAHGRESGEEDMDDRGGVLVGDND